MKKLTIPCDRCGARFERLVDKCPSCGEEIAGRMPPILRLRIEQILEQRRRETKLINKAFWALICIIGGLLLTIPWCLFPVKDISIVPPHFVDAQQRIQYYGAGIETAYGFPFAFYMKKFSHREYEYRVSGFILDVFIWALPVFLATLYIRQKRRTKHLQELESALKSRPENDNNGIQQL